MKRSPRARSAYLGADRAGTEFWLSGPHVFSLSGDGARLHHVCALARFNRRSRSCDHGARPATEDPLAGRSHP